jgi:chitinase
VSVRYATADGMARAGSDYIAAGGTASFAPGATTAEVTILVNGDSVSELDETFSVSLADAVNATLAESQATGTIANDDATPSISIGDASVNEGAAGTASATFLLTLSAASELPVSVTYTTANGTASAGSDYVASIGTASFAPGATTAEVIVLVGGDSLNELDETFHVSLSDPDNATVAGGQATGTIVNDDPVPSISIAGASLNEGSTGTTTATFTLTLSAASEFPVAVNYATADGSGTANADYVASSGTAMFAPGTTSTTVTVLVNGDTLVESDETFLVLLADASNASIAQPQGIATVLNDDAPPVPAAVSVSIADASIAEGSGEAVNLTFTVTLSAASVQPVSVSYATSDGTATAGADYAATSGTLTIPAGALSGTIVVPVIGDGGIEPGETLAVTLADPTAGATVARGFATGTITNDDSLPGLVASYNFDVPESGLVRDTSGHNLHGTISGGAVWTEGHTGGAMFFDGVNDWVRVADDDRLDLPRLTMAAWIRPASAELFDAVIAKGTAVGVPYSLYSSDGARRPAAHVTVGGNEREVEGPVTLPANAWTHLAASFDGARIRLYVNGVLVRTSVRAGMIDSSTGALGIGGNQALGHFFAGVVDDVRIYNRALLDAEVQADMNTPVP